MLRVTLYQCSRIACNAVGCAWKIQPRTCDLRIAKMKKQKLEAKRKKEAEKALRDAEYQELAKERAAKRRQEIKESESQLAESKERFKKMREQKERKIEQVRGVSRWCGVRGSFNPRLQALCDRVLRYYRVRACPCPRA